MKKIIHPCNIEKIHPIFCKIEFENGNLSISGVEHPYSNGNAWGSCGQIEMGYYHKNENQNDKRYTNFVTAQDLIFSEGWNSEIWYKFLDIWHTWHLNDMQSACEHQRQMGWTYEEHCGIWEPDPKIIIDEYDTGEQRIKFNPYKGEACPVCGYSIGSAWLKKEIPQDVIDFLFSLPDTDRKPAWV